jgi:hypothetical protein
VICDLAHQFFVLERKWLVIILKFEKYILTPKDLDKYIKQPGKKEYGQKFIVRFEIRELRIHLSLQF